MATRDQRFFDSLSGLKRGLDAKIEEFSTTDRGLTGIAARSPEDVRERMAKQKAKLARRAARAKK